MMRDRQWIRVQVPDIKSLQIPIKINKAALSNHLLGLGKDLLEDLSDDEGGQDASPAKKKRKASTIDIVEIFAINPEPTKYYPLETNSSTLALSNNHLLIFDDRELILFDYHKQLSTMTWNDNEYGLSTEDPFLRSFLSFRYSCGHVLDASSIRLYYLNYSFGLFVRSDEIST